MFLSQGRAAGKKNVGALKKYVSQPAISFYNILGLPNNVIYVSRAFGAAGNAGRLRTAVSSPDLSWAKDTSGSILRVKTIVDKYAGIIPPNFYIYKARILTSSYRHTTPSLGVLRLTPLLAHPLRYICASKFYLDTYESANTPIQVPLHLYLKQPSRHRSIMKIRWNDTTRWSQNPQTQRRYRKG